MKVLLTGGSGFIASHCIDVFLQRGHSVVFTVRSAAKGQTALRNYSESSQSKLSYVIVEDIAEPTAFDEAVKSDPPFDVVVHTASPFRLNISDPKELLSPAIIGTTGILKAIKKSAPSVRRVIVTSSFVAMLSPTKHPRRYDGATWNPISPEEAAQNPGNAYRASKTFAERAAWDFMEHEHPNFDLVTINPPVVFGPVAACLNSLNDINTSNARIRNMLRGDFKNGLPGSLGVYLWADVRDVALAHVKAAEVQQAGDKRFLLAANEYMSNADVAGIIVENFPELADKLPAKLESDLPADVYAFDNSESKEILEIEYRTLKDSVVDTVKSLIRAGA
ncbi:methylglyoxal reductase (NADPH-dependent) gre2 [Cladophialophora chaetospira]|uniref:Methylglyoxal reductase (NADPH-dependent) gre2 n=1 Tax=Cladophialophora chaetospira TaxID=386627 RepID=A0AA39CNK1_9EURO|nr:methylglyoxal reductase (NADPH-dependent) gre2 [Cladophialophora chaetospira]